MCGRPPLWTDRHLWKHNLRKLHLWTVLSINGPPRDFESWKKYWKEAKTLAVWTHSDAPMSTLQAVSRLMCISFCFYVVLWSIVKLRSNLNCSWFALKSKFYRGFMFCYSRNLILVTDFLKIVPHCSQNEAVKTRYFSEKKTHSSNLRIILNTVALSYCDNSWKIRLKPCVCYKLSSCGQIISFCLSILMDVGLNYNSTEAASLTILRALCRGYSCREGLPCGDPGDPGKLIYWVSSEGKLITRLVSRETLRGNLYLPTYLML